MNEQIFDWSSKIKELGPWLLGFFAIIQVWFIALIKRLRKGTISIYESGPIEIGYGDLGPSIGLRGTLRCQKKDVFIINMEVEVQRLKDNATHLFKWYAFRPYEISLGTQNQPKLELASSILATPSQPNRYNIFFTESAFISENSPKLKPYIEKWHSYVKKRFDDFGEEERQRAIEELGNQQLTQGLFDKFSEETKDFDTYSLLDRAFYWDEGVYQLSLIIEAAEPKRNFQKHWEFAISTEESDRLRLNTFPILKAICGLQVTFNFSFPDYINRE